MTNKFLSDELNLSQISFEGRGGRFSSQSMISEIIHSPNTQKYIQISNKLYKQTEFRLNLLKRIKKTNLNWINEELLNYQNQQIF